MKYETILLNIDPPIAYLFLNRPEVHNAFNAIMIRELSQALEEIKQRSEIRVLILSGKGKSFCAGADLNWMREIINYSFEENLRESRQLAELIYQLDQMPLPTIARINGATIGGGNGFQAACDLAIACDEAIFSLSEVKIGLVPAVISPYVIRRIGESRARQYFLTGERIIASKAEEIGLVHQCVPTAKLDEAVSEAVNLLLTSGPTAIARAKDLIHKVSKMSIEEAKEYTARIIAELRISPEGQEGMSAFLEKRKPRWVQEAELIWEKLKNINKSL
ncbi:MAG: enoyl-CoA hydratase/isomerase family protein [Candidatus Aminicenantes bacterium]|nr:enoyl-CoA hydratase/isomerase family protein [Candidatus Aminicenantes bacterium]